MSPSDPITRLNAAPEGCYRIGPTSLARLESVMPYAEGETLRDRIDRDVQGDSTHEVVSGFPGPLALSPDGRTLAYTGRTVAIPPSPSSDVVDVAVLRPDLSRG